MSHAIVVMGVSGCGKTTVGQALAHVLDVTFYDGDDFHPAENIAKMSQGKPLNDNDRQPWLERLRDLINKHLEEDTGIVVACSALKQRYRDLLREGNESLKFVYLDGTFDVIWGRIQARDSHYMKADMLQSQFDVLEPPGDDEAIRVSVDQPLDAMMREIVAALPD